MVNIIHRAITLASKNSICETCNVLTGESVTIDELAEQMMKILDVKVEVNYQSLATGDPEQSNGSTKKMVKLFTVKLNKLTKLNNGLMDTVQYILRDIEI